MKLFYGVQETPVRTEVLQVRVTRAMLDDLKHFTKPGGMSDLVRTLLQAYVIYMKGEENYESGNDSLCMDSGDGIETGIFQQHPPGT